MMESVKDQNRDRSAERVPPDVVLLAPEWQTRALLRAQLIDEGREVVATNSWPMMRPHLRPGSKPRLAIVDLKGLADPEAVLNDLSLLMNPERVVVLTAAATVPMPNIQRLGFHVLSRPIVIDEVITLVNRLTGE
jgi:hypothetical protein